MVAYRKRQFGTLLLWTMYLLAQLREGQGKMSLERPHSPPGCPRVHRDLRTRCVTSLSSPMFFPHPRPTLPCQQSCPQTPSALTGTHLLALLVQLLMRVIILGPKISLQCIRSSRTLCSASNPGSPAQHCAECRVPVPNAFCFSFFI